MAKNYSKMELGSFGKDLAEKGRVMAGETLALTGCELSFNATPAGEFTPFVHTHKLNEEVYIILSGSGEFMADDEEFPIREGSVIRVSPDCKRAIKAGDETLVHICVQAQSGSLTQATADDGVLSDAKASWMKK
ncbi:cupin domain-containing protein [Oscillospiraceae bacterium OttesenSCG-928-G22]|nr:cupin domain-containing protein [Oscillospiraceae bacterium OttesenSCG-928-G22]